MLIPGYATPEGTARFRDRFTASLPGHHRLAHGLWLSSIGIGTYLGEPSEDHDSLYRNAIRRAVERGTNVIDSAVNYRYQRSERAIGQVLEEMMRGGALRRDEIFISTKGGFLTTDGTEPDDPAAYFEENLIKPGLVRPEDVAAGCHVISPKYLENQIEVSRNNLRLETIDLYYLHNPETQLSAVSRQEFFRRLKAAFAQLEKSVSDGKIRCYGTATWNAYRVSPEAKDGLSLADIARAAEELGGKNHHFRAIQLPFNIAMPEALTSGTQLVDGKRVTPLQAAQIHRLTAFTSATLLQGRLSDGLPAEIRERFPAFETDAQRAIQFARSTPGVTCALVGMGHTKHVEENLGTARVAPLNAKEFAALFAKPSG